jgi:hypothetical protein
MRRDAWWMQLDLAIRLPDTRDHSMAHKRGIFVVTRQLFSQGSLLDLDTNTSTTLLRAAASRRLSPGILRSLGWRICGRLACRARLPLASCGPVVCRSGTRVGRKRSIRVGDLLEHRAHAKHFGHAGDSTNFRPGIQSEV